VPAEGGTGVELEGLDLRLDGDVLQVTVTLRTDGRATSARVAVHAFGAGQEQLLHLASDASAACELRVAAGGAARWSPGQPVLHDLLVDVTVDGTVDVARRARIGLRAPGSQGGRLTLDDAAVPVRGAVVGSLPTHAGGSERAAAESVVALASALGLNALQLVGDAVREVMLDVCDERGMLVALDPTTAAGAGATAHPSVVLHTLPGEASASASRALPADPAGVVGGVADALELTVVRGPCGLPEPDNDTAGGVRTTVAALGGEADGRTGGRPGSPARLRRGTRERQGRALRAALGAARRARGVAGFWLDPLLDGPGAPRGVLDAGGGAKEETAEHVLDACGLVVPSLAAPTVAMAGTAAEAQLWIVNDGEALTGADVLVRLGGVELTVAFGAVPAMAVAGPAPLAIAVPTVAGGHVVDLRVRAAGREEARGRHELHVVAAPPERAEVRLLGSGITEQALVAIDVTTAASDGVPVVVSEDALGAAGVASDVQAALDAGSTVLVLAQSPDAAAFLPVQAELETAAVGREPPILVTTDSGALPALPRRAVLGPEIGAATAGATYRVLGDPSSPRTPVVLAVHPTGEADDTVVVGEVGVARGRLLVCQLRLAEPAMAGDPGARAVLRDLVRWAAAEGPPVVAERTRKDDGRHITFYWLGRSER
jgi:hypothetical protein